MRSSVLTSPGGAPSTNEVIVFSCEEVILAVGVGRVLLLPFRGLVVQFVI